MGFGTWSLGPGPWALGSGPWALGPGPPAGQYAAYLWAVCGGLAAELYIVNTSPNNFGEYVDLELRL